MDGAPVPTARTKVRGWSVWPGPQWIEHRFRQAENPINSPEIVVRTSLHKRVGGYDARLPQAADMELWMRMAAQADVGFVRGVDQAYYRIHQQNMSNAITTLRDLRERRLVFGTVLDRDGEKLSDPDRMSVLVHRALAREALWAAGRAYDRGPLRRTELASRLLGAGPNEDEREVDELLSFASDCWPGVSGLSLYRTLRWRKHIGPRGTYYMLNQKGQWWLRRRSWKYRGF
jgi:hypothetical protein